MQTWTAGCGGVMNTLAALCTRYDMDMYECAIKELKRCWDNIDKIRSKQKTKVRYSKDTDSSLQLLDALTEFMNKIGDEWDHEKWKAEIYEALDDLYKAYNKACEDNPARL